MGPNRPRDKQTARTRVLRELADVSIDARDLELTCGRHQRQKHGLGCRELDTYVYCQLVDLERVGSKAFEIPHEFEC